LEPHPVIGPLSAQGALPWTISQAPSAVRLSVNQFTLPIVPSQPHEIEQMAAFQLAEQLGTAAAKVSSGARTAIQ
jgi:hypothetical protein